MARLSIHLLGSFRVTLDGEPVTAFESDKVRALLAYLAVEAGRPHRRERLVGLLWPDWPERSARASLSQALYNLRAAIGDRSADPPFLLVTPQTLQFNRQSDHSLDVGLLADLPREAPAAQLGKAVDACSGSFLAGFSLPGSGPFEDWVVTTREELHRLALEAIAKLAAYHETRAEYAQALSYARRGLSLDPTWEPGHRSVMRLLALSGERSAALAHYEACRGVLQTEVGADPSEETQALFELLVSGEQPTPLTAAPPLPDRPPRSIGRCPYRGLAAFREEDAPFFFGREAFVERLSEAAHRRPLVAVIVGSSGSGKSSAVYAGLLPRLRQESDWLVIPLRPGAQPFQALAAAVLPLLEPDLDETDRLIRARKLGEALRQEQVPLQDAVERALEKEPDTRRALLLVDQFEELYTLCPDPQEQRRFLDGLLAAVEPGGGRREPPLVALLTLRADFMGQALSHRPFADALQENALILGPMTRDELRAAIVKPAEVQGAAFEEGLVQRVLDDVGAEPGNLPLLEFALTLLWERHRYGWLTHEGYEEIGRVAGALAQHADQVYRELDEAEQERARRVFVQLVRPGEGTEDTRRVATRAEVGEENWPLVRHLADRRLVVTGRDATTDHETAEVVHEALIQRWRQLQEWMAQDRAFRTWQERLRAALRAWEASGQDEGALLRGVPLAEAEGWLVERTGEIGNPERDYIQASAALRERRVVERERRRRRTTLALAGGLVVAMVLAIFALVARQQANRSAEVARAEAGSRATAESVAVDEREEARRQASISLAAQALVELGGKFPGRAVPLALEALEEYPYTWQAEHALGQAVLENRLQLILSGHTEYIHHVAWSPDGRRIVTGGLDKTAIIWDGVTGERLVTLSGHPERVLFTRWSPSGNHVATSCADGTTKVWDAATGTELLTLSGTDVAWSSGDRVATTGHTEPSGVWDATTGEKLLTIPYVGYRVAWSSAGGQIATAKGDTIESECIVKVWDENTGEELLTLSGHNDRINQVSWSPSGDRILTASDDRTARIWDATTGEELHVLTGHQDWVCSALWSPSGDRISTASQDGVTRVWDAATGESLFTFDPGDPQTAVPRTFKSTAIDWSPDGDHIATTRFGSYVTVLDAESGDEIFTLAGHTGRLQSLDWSPDGDRLVTVGSDATARVWDVSPRARVLSGHTDQVSGVAWSPSGDRLATASLDGTARTWDLTTGEELLVIDSRASSLGEVMWFSSGDRIATRAMNWWGSAIKVWDVSASSPTYGAALTITELHVGSAMSWSPEEDRFVTTGDDGTVQIWDAITGESLLVFRGHGYNPVLSVDWSPDGERIVTTGSNGDGLVWDPHAGEVLLELRVGEGVLMSSAAWSPDGKRIATHSDDAIGGRIWDASASSPTYGQALLTFTGHTATVWSLAWSASGDRLLTASEDATAHVWDTLTGAKLLSYTFSGPVGSSAWSSDMRHIAFGQNDGTVWIVDVNWSTREELMAYARECCLIRELTADERELFGLPPSQ